MSWKAALERLRLERSLGGFDPTVAGTFPLGLDVPGSDLDVLCHAPDLAAFAARAEAVYGRMPGFSLEPTHSRQGEALLCHLRAEGVPVEIFAQPLPVRRQDAYRHFRIEARLLMLLGRPFRERVLLLRRGGAKTEPAFAVALGLPGDPYLALLDLEPAANPQIFDLWSQALARPFPPPEPPPPPEDPPGPSLLAPEPGLRWRSEMRSGAPLLRGGDLPLMAPPKKP